MGTRFIHILRERGGRWMPVRSWVIWGGVEALEWNDSRWREFDDGAYRMRFDDLPPIPFTVRDGHAYLDGGAPLRLT